MTDNNFKIKGSDGATIPLNALFTTRDDGSSNTADKFDYWKNKDSNGVMSNYITGKNNKGTYLSGAVEPDPLAGPDSTGNNLGYLRPQLNDWNNKFGIDSCTFTDYQGPDSSLSLNGITANYLGAYFEDFFVNVQNFTSDTSYRAILLTLLYLHGVIILLLLWLVVAVVVGQTGLVIMNFQLVAVAEVADM